MILYCNSVTGCMILMIIQTHILESALTLSAACLTLIDFKQTDSVDAPGYFLLNLGQF